MSQNNENWKKLIVDGWCKCKLPNKVILTDDLTGETFDMCLRCNLEIEPVKKDEKEEELDMSTCNDLVPDTNDEYENSQCASQDMDTSYEFGIR